MLCHALERVDEARRRGMLETIRPDERGQKTLPALLVHDVATDRSSELPYVGGKLRCGFQQPAFDRQQIPEVRHPLLMDSVRGQLQCEDRRAENRCLEKSTRTQSNNCGAVVERIEVLGLRIARNWRP